MIAAVVGAQWGDEGKGKIVDYLTRNAEIVVRFAGGANAGHTIVIGGKVHKLHLVPTGILRPWTTVVLGTGMVIDPVALFQELSLLEGEGVSWKGRLLIADRAHLVLPRYHKMDVERDKKRRSPLGTTGRGIGVAYAQKSSREGIRVGDLYDPQRWEACDRDDKFFLSPYREKMAAMVTNISSYLRKHERAHILFEGAQGTLLDLDAGTYPFVSSGCSCSVGAALGGGIGPGKIEKVLGVFKAYATRVGEGPFPTEFSEKREGVLRDRIRTLGHEYGTTTGRPRRCGYLDLVALDYACWVNGTDALALTHLDIYNDFEEIGVCVGYTLKGERRDEFPTKISDLTAVRPLIEWMKGWRCSLSCQCYEDLPEEAQAFIAFIEDHVQIPVEIISVGQEREATFARKPFWEGGSAPT